MDSGKTGEHGKLSDGAAEGISLTSPAFAQNAKGRATRRESPAKQLAMTEIEISP